MHVLFIWETQVIFFAVTSLRTEFMYLCKIGKEIFTNLKLGKINVKESWYFRNVKYSKFIP